MDVWMLWMGGQVDNRCMDAMDVWMDGWMEDECVHQWIGDR